MKRIALLGATGYTGELVAALAAKKGIGLIIGGRDAQRLKQVNRDCGGIHEPRVADLNDDTSLRRLIDGAGVLIDTAGPFTDLGPPVIRACLDAGVHFLDSTGEQAYMIDAFRTFGAPAESAGISVIPSMAFEYSLGDSAAVLAALRLPDVRDMDVFYYTPGFATSRGTKLSALKIFGGETFAFENGSLVSQVPGSRQERVAFMDEPGVHTALCFPGGEVVLLPRHLDLKNVNNWMVMKPKAARLLKPASGAVAAAGKSPFVKIIERGLKTTKRGPTPDERKAGRFKILVRGTSPSGIVRCQVWGSDMYGLTAAIILYGALRLAAEPDLPRGVLTPAQVFSAERLLQDIAEYGVSHACEGPY